MHFPSNWSTIAVKIFWIKGFCILPSDWLLRKKNCLLAYHILVIYLLLCDYRIILTKIFLFVRSRLFLYPRHVSKFFRFKGKVPFNLRSSVVYKLSCGRCNATCYGETCQHLSIRVGEHSGVSPLTGKNWKAKTTTAIKDYMLICDHVISLEDFKILASSNSEFHFKGTLMQIWKSTNIFLFLWK